MRDVLVLSERYDPFDAAVGYAASLAARLGGLLTGLHVFEPAPVATLPEAPAIGMEFLAAAHEGVARARRAQPEFALLLSAAGIAHGSWNVALAPHAAAVARYAHWHDLLVFDAPHDDSLVSMARAGGLLIGSGLPCLVVPPDRAAPAAFERIVVAWNGAPESIRALRAARPLLALAKRLVVLTGTTRHGSDIVLPDSLALDAWAAREALTIEHYPLEAPDDRSGHEILSVASAMGADLLVMGAYGRSRFNEWLLGGATRHVLAHARLPVLMRH